jgi:hypothetical protein
MYFFHSVGYRNIQGAKQLRVRKIKKDDLDLFISIRILHKTFFAIIYGKI